MNRAICAAACLVLFTGILRAADDRTTASSLAEIRAGINDIRVQMVGMRSEMRTDRSAMLQRTNGFTKALAEMSARIDNLDVAHLDGSISSDQQRIEALETAAKLAREDRDQRQKQDQQEHDSIMAWVRPASLALFGLFAGYIFNSLVTAFRQKRVDKESAEREKHSAQISLAHRDRMEEGMERVRVLSQHTAETSLHTAENTNNMKDELVALTAKSSHAEGVIEGKAARVDPVDEAQVAPRR